MLFSMLSKTELRRYASKLKTTRRVTRGCCQHLENSCVTRSLPTTLPVSQRALTKEGELTLSV
ncbi:hypothetical protein P3T16_005501 [Paraburkholderia sp. GAS42]